VPLACDTLERLPPGRDVRLDPELLDDGGIVALAQSGVGLVAPRAGVGKGDERIGTEGHALLLAVIVVVPTPQLAAARGDEQVKAAGVGELVGFGARLGGANLRIGQQCRSPESTTFFDRACHVFVPPIRRIGMDGDERPRPS
jgi:hypothetical protein